MASVVLAAVSPPAAAQSAGDPDPAGAAATSGCIAGLDSAESLRRSLAELGTDFEHLVPDLEAMLPSEVAGRPLATWSTSGADLHRSLFGLTDDEVAAYASDLAAEGFDIDGIQIAVAGRSDVGSDPPYLVEAWRVVGVPVASLPLADYVAFPDAGDWSRMTWSGREVSVGTGSMLIQDEHERGRPYVYDVGDIRFIVTTDEEAWAREAIARLCPQPEGGG